MEIDFTEKEKILKDLFRITDSDYQFINEWADKICLKKEWRDKASVLLLLGNAYLTGRSAGINKAREECMQSNEAFIKMYGILCNTITKLSLDSKEPTICNDSFDSLQDTEEDIIVVHLGKRLSAEEYQLVGDSIAAFMSQRFPYLTNSTLKIN